MKPAVNSSLVAVAGKKVFVGLSGGVDSAVTATLLKDAGAHVTCVFIKGWYPPGMPCTWASDRRDAMRVAAHLRLPFTTLDASKEYKKGVIDYLLREYKAGRTPNPDIMCNREVKFGAFYSFARAQGADYIATGHYARVIHEREDKAGSAAEKNRAALLRGVDEGKDQSYFLWAISREALVHTLFPLGALQKSTVRQLAEEYKLPNAHRRDSQGICFLGSISIEDFLTQEFGTKHGKAIDEKGRSVGEHLGALLATLGQKVALQNAAPGPWYVLSKEIEANELVVSKKLESNTRESFSLTGVNLFKDLSMADSRLACEAQYRYHGMRITGVFDSATHTFFPDEPLAVPVAAGQSLVLYLGEECIGGGIIG